MPNEVYSLWRGGAVGGERGGRRVRRREHECRAREVRVCRGGEAFERRPRREFDGVTDRVGVFSVGGGVGSGGSGRGGGAAKRVRQI